MWAAHSDEAGAVVGCEERGPDWRGFSSGGTKVLFRLGPAAASRLCVTEAAIDGLSLAAIEDARADSLYLSTSGGWSPSTVEAIPVLVLRQGHSLIAATDNDEQGEGYAARLETIAAEAACGFERLRPVARRDRRRPLLRLEPPAEGGPIRDPEAPPQGRVPIHAKLHERM